MTPGVRRSTRTCFSRKPVSPPGNGAVLSDADRVIAALARTQMVNLAAGELRGKSRDDLKHDVETPVEARGEVESQSADPHAIRRIHYWVLPGSPIAFARVTTPDDFDV